MARVVALVLAAWWSVGFFGVVDLLTVLQGMDFRAELMLSTGWGLVFLALVAAPLLVVAARPSAAPTATVQLACVALAIAVGALLAGSPAHLAVAAGVLASALVVAALAGARAVRTTVAGWRWSWRPGVLVLLAAGPAMAYAWSAARAYGVDPVSDQTLGLDHWPVQAAFPLAVLLVAALGAGAPRGWAVPTWCVTGATAWFAVVAWWQPHLAGSVGRGWSGAALLWAVADAVVLHRDARRRGVTTARRPSSSRR